ncbi:putative Zn-finger protein [Methylohalomonas lacus]|uniref:Zn-finger protein n=1 Tax=Methylohalomonas lacus TaxID=398773 RepID=A0AAE3HKA1_9GAMM|nr:zinc-finger domain-containing protein [Methylohalomonas lacus]MCS3903335.1 putative Zn-finger protein [Methylohalomonas lacus]
MTTSENKATPNDRNQYTITHADLPLHCPLPSMSLWNSHPKVYLPVETTGQAKCPYCGCDFVLRDE